MIVTANQCYIECDWRKPRSAFTVNRKARLRQQPSLRSVRSGKVGDALLLLLADGPLLEPGCAALCSLAQLGVNAWTEIGIILLG